MSDSRQRDGDRRGQREDTEDSGPFVESVVHIYESVEECVSGPQGDKKRDNAAGRHTQGQRTNAVRRPFGVVAVCLGMLCLTMLAVNIGLVVYYILPLSLERNQLKTDNNDLTLERQQLLLKLQLKREKAADKSCPRGWKKFGCKCYQRSTKRKTWHESRAECLAKGADLVIIKFKEEQEFIQELAKEGRWSPWIGLNRTGVDWTWVDGTPLTTQYWEPGFPADTEDWNCALFRNGTWCNRDCSADKRGWVCEM